MTVRSQRIANPAALAARLVLAAAFGLFMLPSQSQASAQAEDIQIVELKGDVRVTMAGSPREVRAGSTLELPSTVRTGSDGSIDLRQGETSIGIGADTHLEFPAPTAAADAADRIVQPLGSAFYNVGPRKGKRLHVETPYLVAVIKGTQFNVAVAPDSSTISLFEGSLEVRSTDTSAVVQLNAGEVAIRNRGDEGIRVIPMKQPAAPAAGLGGKTGGNGGDDSTTNKVAFDADVDTGKSPVTPVGVDTDTVVEVGKGGVEAGVDADVAVGPANVGVGVEVGIDPGSGGIDAGVDAGVDLGPVAVDAGAEVAADLGAGTVDLGLDAGVDAGIVSAELGADAGVDLGAGTIDAGLDAGLDAGIVSAELGADVGADLGAGTVDAGLDAGLLGTDTSLDVGLDLSGPDAGLDVGLDILGAEIDLGLGGDPEPAETTPTAPSGQGGGGVLGGILGGLLGGG